MKVELSGAQGTRIIGTPDRIDRREREKKAIQLSGPQPGPSNNPQKCGWAPKPYLYIESSVLSVLSQQKTSILSQQKTEQLLAGGRQLPFNPLRQERHLLLLGQSV